MASPLILCRPAAAGEEQGEAGRGKRHTDACSAPPQYSELLSDRALCAVSLSAGSVAVSVPVTLSPSETASVAVSEAGSVAAEVPPVTVVAAPVVSAAVACS